MPSTDDFSAFYRAAFGEPFPFDPGPLVPVGARAWGSPALSAEPFEPPVIPAFRATAGDYALLGAWGHGVQSHALYCVERRARKGVFVRLPWAGAYGEPDGDARRVRQTLARYAALRERVLLRLAEGEIVSNMGDERARLVWPDGGTETIVGPSPLAPAPPFWDVLARALGRD
jgi:hypothetical protein